jgi:hypothetical protein
MYFVILVLVQCVRCKGYEVVVNEMGKWYSSVDGMETMEAIDECVVKDYEDQLKLEGFTKPLMYSVGVVMENGICFSRDVGGCIDATMNEVELEIQKTENDADIFGTVRVVSKTEEPVVYMAGIIYSDMRIEVQPYVYFQECRAIIVHRNTSGLCFGEELQGGCYFGMDVNFVEMEVVQITEDKIYIHVYSKYGPDVNKAPGFAGEIEEYSGDAIYIGNLLDHSHGFDSGRLKAADIDNVTNWDLYGHGDVGMYQHTTETVVEGDDGVVVVLVGVVGVVGVIILVWVSTSMMRKSTGQRYGAIMKDDGIPVMETYF